MKFTEERLEQAIIRLLEEQGYPHVQGTLIERASDEVLIKEDLQAFLAKQYQHEGITKAEIDSVIRQLGMLPASDLYDSNKQFCEWLSDGFLLKREDPKQKDLYIQLIDYPAESDAAALPELAMAAEPKAEYQVDCNIYKLVNQLKIEGRETHRIPDGILYINGLPLVVFEFKSAIKEDEANIHHAYVQLTTRYRRDIPQLFVYNALCVISDGVNNKMGSLFADYEFFYAWRKVTGDESIEKEGIDSLHTMLNGLFDKQRLRQVLRHFIYFPDKANQEVKIVCRYPQFYAVNKLYDHILQHKKPEGDGKGGTYFGATGCGKSFTMQFLARRLMKSLAFESPTIVLITDRTDLDDQLSKQMSNAKTYIGDNTIETVKSREHLRTLLKGRNSGGVFLTTIHKFTEDTELLTERDNVICISDEAHRSQVNLDQKVSITEDGVKKSYGFAYHLHQSLPNATYVGFTGTPIDATLEVFGEVVDSYTMSESVKDEITVRIVYEGRAAKVILDNRKLEEIEKYYQDCAEAGASEYQIEESKKAVASMGSILGDPDRIRALAKDFVAHYENRIDEGSTVKGKAMFVSSERKVAWAFYKELRSLRPQWFEVLECEEGVELSDSLSESERKKIKPMERVRMVMTRGKDDEKELYDLLGNKDYRKELDRQFKNGKSNFKIAIVVDMWLTGFDVPFLDTIYIDKPIQKHNLIQTISRVNRKFSGKDKGLVVDYIGIKSQMNQALAQFSKADEANFEDIQQSVIVVKDHLDLLRQMFHKFDASGYFSGSTGTAPGSSSIPSIPGGNPVAQLNCLNNAAEFVLKFGTLEKRFMALVKRLKAAYDVCCGSELLTGEERDRIHFYLAVRSIVFKLTKGEAPDTAQMNAKVRDLITQAIQSDGVEDIFRLGEDGATARDGGSAISAGSATGAGEINIFSEDYLAKIDKIKLPHTKIQLLQKMLAKAIEGFKETNRAKGIEFTQKFQSLVNRYNERKEEDVLVSEVLEEFSDEILDLMADLKREMSSFDDMGISFEEKAFYDILMSLAVKYDFSYPEDKLVELSQAVKAVVDDKARFPDWNNRDDIKASLKVDLILLLAKFGYPPVSRDEVYKEIFEQAENFKKNRL